MSASDRLRTVRLGDVRVPTLIVLHKPDGCSASPPADAAAVLKALARSPRKEILAYEGGSSPRSEPCEAMSQHGFFGLEADVLEASARWIRAATPS